ncbi:MAG TPA: vitamin B12-dependent ribonucleotide reductase [Streptosporangiaceae bacterium]|jgi:ribonucleoside-diphosphate reductase alpha chain|nr:vitamin B12-dependent ribonucleotide reductase [Streptosporangiaceae bacterium]
MTETTASGAAQGSTGARKGLTIRRIHTREGVHPYDEITWERRDVVMTNWRDGSVNFEQKGVEFPDFWSVNAANIVTTKYFRGAVGTPQREWSLKQLVDRVVGTYVAAGREHGYFATNADAEIFSHELSYALVHQIFSFNSPVWFNVGTSSPQQVSACQPYDALVSTPAGPVPIGRLVDGNAVGAKVHDAHGTTWIVAVKANGVKEVLRLHTSGGQTLDVTADHLVWRAADLHVGEFTVAGFLRPGDQLLHVVPDVGGSDRTLTQLSKVERLGPMEVYDIQTESGEYLSGSSAGLRVHNCFILAVDDTMDSILEWYREEGLIFKGGSGAGVNLSRIRSSKELLSSGGTASGPVSFMRGADASAGTIKSGGATRRAAKMVVLDVDHPDIEEFIVTKAREEEKIRVLRDAGFDMDLGGKDIVSVQYQNANNSVRVSDEFMNAVEKGGTFDLAARRTGEIVQTIDAKSLFRKMAQAAWECADPGIQYDSTINDWHTCPESGRITASNPCSEYLSLDNSSCNLASINLLKFLREDDTFDVERFEQLTELIITAMDISICFADFPTEKITAITRAYRQLGIGYANLGALLMATGHAYDSEGGRAIAAAITSLMTGTAYRRSAELAAVVGPYDGYTRNATAHQRVMSKHAAASAEIKSLGGIDETILAAANRTWQQCLELGRLNGYRNAQASLLAPTGTIGLMMDCDTTGVEPDLALVKFKKLVGGGSMQIVNQTVPRALKNLGYQPEQAEAIIEYISEHGHVLDAPGLRPEHYEVFDCAMGQRAISPMGHVRMMAAVQPALSGAISKTVNLPQSATIADIERIYFEGWKLGLKALAIYRDNCKVGQPLSAAKKKAAEAEAPATEPTAPHEVRPVRRRLPKQRSATVTRFSVAGAEGYMTASSYPGDGIGEVFLKLGKQGSTLAGVMDAFSIAISVGLQYGIPLESYVAKFTNMRFDPAGITDDQDIRMASSVMDYIFRRLALDHLSYEQRSELGILSVAERSAALAGEDPAASADEVDPDELAQSVPVEKARSQQPEDQQPERQSAPDSPAPPHSSMELIEAQQGRTADAPLCLNCGTKMRPAGSCYVCEGCGSTSGCS